MHDWSTKPGYRSPPPVVRQANVGGVKHTVTIGHVPGAVVAAWPQPFAMHRISPVTRAVPFTVTSPFNSCGQWSKSKEHEMMRVVFAETRTGLVPMQATNAGIVCAAGGSVIITSRSTSFGFVR